MATLTRRFLAALTHSGPSYQPPAVPSRGDDVQTWLLRKRGDNLHNPDAWLLIESLISDYDVHAETGIPLGQPVNDPYCTCGQAEAVTE